MERPIGVRLPAEIMNKIENLGKEEMEDRSTIIRKLVMIGYTSFMIRKAAEKYIKGKITLSAAAKQAGLTVWEMEEYLVSQGFKSNYSLEDMERELKAFKR